MFLCRSWLLESLFLPYDIKNDQLKTMDAREQGPQDIMQHLSWTNWPPTDGRSNSLRNFIYFYMSPYNCPFCSIYMHHIFTARCYYTMCIKKQWMRVCVFLHIAEWCENGNNLT